MNGPDLKKGPTVWVFTGYYFSLALPQRRPTQLEGLGGRPVEGGMGVRLPGREIQRASSVLNRGG